MEYNVLVVEDEIEICDAIEIYLKTQGYHVYKANNGQEGLNIISNQTIHLAIVNIGVDDYVTKPFVPMELLARVSSQLRRYSRYLNVILDQQHENSYVVGGLELNLDTKQVTVEGKIIKVTPIEFKILQLLMEYPGKVFSADNIYESVWQEDAISTDTVMVHVRNLREKIEIDPKNPRYLKVVWGVGYKIEK